MSARPRLTDCNNAGHDLENALRQIKGVADVLYSLKVQPDDSDVLTYLSEILLEHHEDAMDAFCRIFALNQYREGDDELFALIAEYERREKRANEPDIDDDERARRCDLSSEVRDQISKIRPLTFRGVLAALDFGSGIEDVDYWPEEAIEGLRVIVNRGGDDAA